MLLFDKSIFYGKSCESKDLKNPFTSFMLSPIAFSPLTPPLDLSSPEYSASPKAVYQDQSRILNLLFIVASIGPTREGNFN